MEASWFGYRSSGDHPQDHLVKFGYKQDMKVKKFKASFTFLAMHARTK
jgi:hypothetical protein